MGVDLSSTAVARQTAGTISTMDADSVAALHDPGTLSNAQLQSMPAPPEVPDLLWNLSSPDERRALLTRSQSDPAPVVLAQAATIAIPAGGAAGVLAGLGGRLAIPLALLSSVFLLLSGDTPQPQAYQIADDLRLYVSADGRNAWFSKTEGGLRFGPGTLLPRQRVLNVPVQVQNGHVTFDVGALERAYGRPLPDSIAQMAPRPAGVSNSALQTTRRGAALAMAASPDPCKNEPGQNHHIIPAQLMQQHETFLTQIGFRLDDPNNLIRLPQNTTQQASMRQMCGATRPIHEGSHGQYSQAINDRLSAIEGSFIRGDITQAQARAQVNALMDGARGILNSGGAASGGAARVNDASIVRAINNLRL